MLEVGVPSVKNIRSRPVRAFCQTTCGPVLENNIAVIVNIHLFFRCQSLDASLSSVSIRAGHEFSTFIRPNTSKHHCILDFLCVPVVGSVCPYLSR